MTNTTIRYVYTYMHAFFLLRTFLANMWVVALRVYICTRALSIKSIDRPVCSLIKLMIGDLIKMNTPPANVWKITYEKLNELNGIIHSDCTGHLDIRREGQIKSEAAPLGLLVLQSPSDCTPAGTIPFLLTLLAPHGPQNMHFTL